MTRIFALFRNPREWPDKTLTALTVSMGFHGIYGHYLVIMRLLLTKPGACRCSPRLHAPFGPEHAEKPAKLLTGKTGWRLR